MDKILSKDTIKNVFSALGAKTSDSNYGVALLDKTSGEPKGLMGMSDLASVLGEPQELNNTDLNTITSPGVYYAKAGCTNRPANYFIFQVISKGSDIVQYGTTISSASQYGFWSRYKNNEGWSDWQRCDNFGCSTPEALASLMGGMNNSETKAYGQNEFDANTLVCGCVRGLNFKNTPAIDGYLVSLGTTKTGVTLLRIQIFYDGQAGKIYMRAGYPEMYTEWKEV